MAVGDVTGPRCVLLRYAQVYGVGVRPRLTHKAAALAAHHAYEDVRLQADRLRQALDA